VQFDLSDVDEGEYEDYAIGEVIFTQGEAASSMYLVVEGSVRLLIAGKEVAVVEEGGVMGEMSLLDGSPRSALAEAADDCRMLPIDRGLFRQMVSKNPEFARLVLGTMAHRLRRMNIAAGGTGGEHVDITARDATGALDLTSLGHLKTTFPAGATIFEEGADGDHMYLVQSGSVEVRVAGKTVHTVDTGGFFGEMALVEEAPRSASAVAETECHLMPIDRQRFEYLIAKTPDFIIEMMRVMAARLRQMNRFSRPGD